MPKEDLLSDLPDLYEPSQVPPEVEERLARKFEVSFETLVRRLVELRAISWELGKWLLNGAVFPYSDISAEKKPYSFKLNSAPIISPDNDPPLDQEFRCPGDPPHLVRLRQAPPPGFRLFTQGVEVAEISFEGTRENALLFAHGRERPLELRRDPLNPFDPNAVEVLGRWKDEEGKEFSGHLGWVPKEAAARLATEAPRGNSSLPWRL